MANFWRVLEFDKFAVEWPLLTLKPKSFRAKELILRKDYSRKNISDFNMFFVVSKF
jgi:hypothetical protein